MFLKPAPLFCAAFFAACTVEVDDLTDTDLRYNAPVNAQDFRVQVRSNVTIDEVDLSVEGRAPTAMAAAGGGTYVVTVPTPVCASAVNYDVTVDGPSIAARTFPRGGRYAREIRNLPDECENFVDGFARTFFVDRRADFVDSTPGDGICAGQTAGGNTGCSLRAAVMETNALPGDDLIVIGTGRFPLDVLDRERESGTLVDASVGDLDITDNVTIERRGGTRNRAIDALVWPASPGVAPLEDDPAKDSAFSKIDGNNSTRHFDVHTGATLRLRFVALVNGRASQGGAIRNSGTLTTERVIIANNRGTRGGTTGGGLYNTGTYFGTDTVFAHNTASGPNPSGGAIATTDTSTIDLRRSLIAFNSARFGIAVLNRGDLAITNTVFHGNSLSVGNGAVVDTRGPVAELNHVTFSANVNSNRSASIFTRINTQRLRNSLMIGNNGVGCGGFDSAGGNVTDLPCRVSAGSTPLLPDSFDLFGGERSGVVLTDLSGFFPVPGLTAADRASIDGTAGVPLLPLTDTRGPGFARSRTVGGAVGTSSDTDAGAVEY